MTVRAEARGYLYPFFFGCKYENREGKGAGEVVPRIPPPPGEATPPHSGGDEERLHYPKPRPWRGCALSQTQTLTLINIAFFG